MNDKVASNHIRERSFITVRVGVGNFDLCFQKNINPPLAVLIKVQPPFPTHTIGIGKVAW